MAVRVAENKEFKFLIVKRQSSRGGKIHLISIEIREGQLYFKRCKGNLPEEIIIQSLSAILFKFLINKVDNYEKAFN